VSKIECSVCRGIGLPPVHISTTKKSESKTISSVHLCSSTSAPSPRAAPSPRTSPHFPRVNRPIPRLHARSPLALRLRSTAPPPSPHSAAPRQPRARDAASLTSRRWIPTADFPTTPPPLHHDGGSPEIHGGGDSNCCRLRGLVHFWGPILPAAPAARKPWGALKVTAFAAVCAAAGGTSYASYGVAPDPYPALVLVVQVLNFTISLPL
jgi:hypothetical protein